MRSKVNKPNNPVCGSNMPRPQRTAKASKEFEVSWRTVIVGLVAMQVCFHGGAFSSSTIMQQRLWPRFLDHVTRPGDVIQRSRRKANCTRIDHRIWTPRPVGSSSSTSASYGTSTGRGVDIVYHEQKFLDYAVSTMAFVGDFDSGYE